MIAAGGIADGRRLAAAFVLGAQGVNVGTRFLASTEATAAEDWKEEIVAAASQDAIKADVINDILPPPKRPGLFDVAPRALRTPFLDQWKSRRDVARRDRERLSGELMEAITAGWLHDLAGFTGQTAGMIHDVLPAAENG